MQRASRLRQSRQLVDAGIQAFQSKQKINVEMQVQTTGVLTNEIGVEAHFEDFEEEKIEADKIQVKNDSD